MTAILGFEPQPAPLTKASSATPNGDRDGAARKLDLNNCKKLFVPTSCFYELIGPHGSTIKAIERRETVKIRVPRRGDSDLSVRVYGTDEAIAGAVQEIDEVLGFAPSESPLIAKFVDIDRKHFHKLIGSGGSTLARLEDETECNIVVPRRDAKEQRVLLEGNEKAVAAALAAINRELGLSLAVDTKADDAALKTLSEQVIEDDSQLAPEPTAEEQVCVLCVFSLAFHSSVLEKRQIGL